MGILFTAIAIFGMTAILGMYLLSLIWRHKTTPGAITIFHGLFAVTALILLVIYCFKHTPGPWVSIIVFSTAAIGGLILYYRDLTGKTVPKWLGILHGLTALTGFALLLWFAFH